MSELSADEMSAMARELGLSRKEIEALLHEPDFAGMVADEQAKLRPVSP
jgi:hypothetical protein